MAQVIDFNGGRGVDRTRDPYDVNEAPPLEAAEIRRFGNGSWLIYGTRFTVRSAKLVQRTKEHYVNRPDRLSEASH